MGQSRTGLDVQVGGLKAGGAGVSGSGVPVGGLSMYRSGLPWRIYNGISTWLDRRFGWDKLPVPLSLAVLVGLRSELRRRNLYDSNLLPTGTLLELPDPPEDYSLRTVDGSYNDLTAPLAGMAGARFGRNIPLSSIDPYPEPTLLEPSHARSVKGCKESPMSLSSPNRSSGLSHCTHERRRND